MFKKLAFATAVVLLAGCAFSQQPLSTRNSNLTQGNVQFQI